MIYLLLVTALHLGYFALSRLLDSRITPLSFFVQYAATAQFLVVQLDVGPVSMRVYNALLLGVLSIPSLGVALRRNQLTPGAPTHAMLCAAFIGWYVFACVFNGTMTNPTMLAVDILSKYLIPVIGFVGALALLRTPSDLRCYIRWLCFIGVANAVFALLQSRGYSLAWNIQASLYPVAQDLLREREAREGLEVVATYPPGLSQYSIGTGYAVLCLGFLCSFFLLSAWLRRHYFRALLALACLLICTLSSVVFMSRSTLYLGGLLLVFIAFLPAPAGSSNAYIRPMMLTALVAAAFVLLSARGLEVAVSDYRNLSVDRIFDLSAGDRLELIRQSLDYVSDRLVFGGKSDAIETRAIQLVPHNVFVNGLLYAGVLGALLSLLVFLNLVFSVFRGVFTGKIQGVTAEIKFMKYAAGVCLVGYLLKGLVHNDSFVIGGIPGWLLWGVWVVADNLEREGHLQR